MMKKYSDLTVAFVFIFLIFGLTLADLIKGDTAISIAERRKLTQAPEISLRTIRNGRFTQDYAAFLEDQVVFRDAFRTIKALTELKLFQKGENNGVFVIGNNLYDKFYGIDHRNIERAGLLINDIIAQIDSDLVYLSVVPSKAHALDSSHYLLSDQNEIANEMRQQTQTAYIDLMALFLHDSGELFYRTDPHWTTPGAIQAYSKLISEMGYEPILTYEFEEITNAYAGSHYGLAALPSIEKDSIYLAHNAILDSLSACRYEIAEAFVCADSIYFLDKINGLDPYDVFLGGTNPIITIENPLAQNEAELVIFKDSFAHSLAPFLAQHFRKVTLFDLRYVRRDFIFDNFDLNGKSILFLYSTTLLNTNPQILN